MNTQSKAACPSAGKVATHMPTPVGPIRIRAHVREQMASMSDEQIAQHALDNGTPFIDPEFFAEHLRRKGRSPSSEYLK